MLKRLSFAMLIFAAPFAAYATDFNTRLTQLDGTPFTEQDGVTPEKTPTTLKKVAVNALLATYPDETNLTGEQKIARFNLAKKIQDSNGDLNLTFDEANLVKTLIQKSMPVVVIGQAVPLIEKSVKPADH